MTSTLYVVATPIGNLSDCSVRVQECLAEVDLILAEDTRRIRKLLTHFGIEAKVRSYRDQNERRLTPELIEQMKHGQSMALVSDAGTPTISDPGYHLVRAAHESDIKVVPIPGACAAVAAVSASGLPTDRFVFLGFLPEKPGKRLSLVREYGELPATLIFYIAKWDIVRYLNEIRDTLSGSRRACLCRELTKQFEEITAGTLDELVEKVAGDTARGEYVLVIAGHEK